MILSDTQMFALVFICLSSAFMLGATLRVALKDWKRK